MASLWNLIIGEIGARLDDELLPRLYAAIGLNTAEVRGELTDWGLPFFDPVTGRMPDLLELEAAAEEIIRRSSRAATLGGAVAGFAGAAALPPEIAAALVQTLRLGQRLCVLYGIDPDTDRGRLILWRAFAAAWEIELPRQGALDLRLRALPGLLRAQVGDADRSMQAFARVLAVRAAVTVGRRTLKILPGMGAALSAYDARKRMRDHGHRMLPVIQRSWEGVPALEGPVEDAVEVRSS